MLRRYGSEDSSGVLVGIEYSIVLFWLSSGPIGQDVKPGLVQYLPDRWTALSLDLVTDGPQRGGRMILRCRPNENTTTSGEHKVGNFDTHQTVCLRRNKPLK